MAANISQDRAAIKTLLDESQVIAVVGMSNKPDRDSYRVGMYLKDAGYTVYAVNPVLQEIEGEPVYATLADVPERIDIVDVFRASEHVAGIVDEVIALGIPNVWTQFGVVDETAAARAVSAGVNVVMDRCIKVEHARLALDGN